MVGESTLAVAILTLNEEVNLPACLASLEGLHAGIWLVDSGSTDGTRRIAESAGVHVVQHEFDNYGAQRRWAQEQIPPDVEWVLHIDADERLTPELVGEINSLMLTSRDALDGYMLRKRTVFLGRWIRHGGHYPSHHLRLFRRSCGTCEDRLYDQHFVVSGTVGTLRYDYIDVVASDLDTWVQRHLRWAHLEAAEVAGAAERPTGVQARLFGDPIQRKRWLRSGAYYRAPLFLRAFLYWGYRYFFRRGFLDGVEGLVFHTYQGLWYRLLVDYRIWEIRRGRHETRRTIGDHHRDE